jgi:hypothetical protein
VWKPKLQRGDFVLLARPVLSGVYVIKKIGALFTKNNLSSNAKLAAITGRKKEKQCKLEAQPKGTI